MIESLESRIAPATFIVTTLADAGDGSLRDAIANANDAPGADLIVFKKGLSGSIKVSTGQMDITDTLTIKGPGPAKLAIDAQQASRIFRVFDGVDESPLSISGLTFANGNSGAAQNGGAILTEEPLKVTNCLFRNNFSEGQGGAIAAAVVNQTTPGNVEIRNSTFTGNSSKLFGGGAVSISVNGSAVVKHSTFTGNISQVRGGALYIECSGAGAVRIEQSQFVANTGADAGAVAIDLQGGKANVVSNAFNGNRAFLGAGGAIGIVGLGDITFDRNLIVQNTAARGGGGFFAEQFNTLKISSSRFLNNASELDGLAIEGGGAIVLGGDQPAGSTAKIIGSIISGNTSSRGGGIYVEGEPFVLQIIGTKIAANRSGDGGGIFIDSNNGDGASVEVLKSTITGNFAANSGGGVYASGNGKLTIKSSKVTLNNSSGGGGLFLVTSTAVTISGSLVAQNFSAGFGGGIVAFVDLELNGSTILGNTSTQLGGGVYSSDRLNLVGCTVSGNMSAIGGGLYQQSAETFSLVRTKVFGNLSNGEQVIDT